MLDQLFKCALINIQTTSLRIMQREYDDLRAASADQMRPGLPIYYCLLHDLITRELDRRQVEYELMEGVR